MILGNYCDMGGHEGSESWFRPDRNQRLIIEWTAEL
jgi:hypothetical protein